MAPPGSTLKSDAGSAGNWENWVPTMGLGSGRTSAELNFGAWTEGIPSLVSEATTDCAVRHPASNIAAAKMTLALKFIFSLFFLDGQDVRCTGGVVSDVQYRRLFGTFLLSLCSDQFLYFTLKSARQLRKTSEFVGITIFLVSSENQVVNEGTEVAIVGH